MTQAFDDRIVKVTIQIGNTRKIYSSPFFIVVNGTKNANSLQNECEITIDNLDQQTRDYILTETSPFNINYSPKSVTVEAGRESYGTTLIYSGNIVSSTGTQPPNISLKMKCLTGNYLKGNLISRSQPGTVSLEVISQSIANDLGVQLKYQATNKNIPNYSYTGESPGQVSKLNSFGGINAFIDNGFLIVKDGGVPINNAVVIMNKSTGMIGIPEVTEQGVRVKFLINNKTELGGSLRLTTQKNPILNGLYVIYKLSFEIASRSQPFYYVAECQRIGD